MLMCCSPVVSPPVCGEYLHICNSSNYQRLTKRGGKHSNNSGLDMCTFKKGQINRRGLVGFVLGLVLFWGWGEGVI